MKKNPLFYTRSNANKGKIGRAKRMLALSLMCLFSIVFISALSISNPTSASGVVKTCGVSIASLAFLPFAAKVKGTKAINGVDESDADFLARKDAPETEQAFAMRFMKHSIEDAIKKANDEWKTQLTSLQEKLAAIKPGEDLTQIKEEMRKQGLTIESLKEVSVVGDRSIKKGSIAETLAKSKDKIDSFLSGKTGGTLSIEHKAGASSTSTDITSRDYIAAWHEPNVVGQIPVRVPFIRELFRNQMTESEFIRYTDQNTVVRDAKNVALCAASTHTTKATWITRAIQISKVRDYTDVCKDMMDDYLFVQGEVERLLDSSVKLKIDDQLLNGTGTHPELNSLSSNASTWAANIAGTKDWSLAIKLPNLIDLIAISRSQVQQLGQMNAFQPNYVFINPGDYELMMHIKNTQGDSVRPYLGMFVDNGGNIYINGMRIIANPNITVNTFWIGDFTKGTVYAKPGVGIEMSYENNANFETETVTVKAYERLNLLIRNTEKNAFMKCTSISAALTAITAP